MKKKQKVLMNKWQVRGRGGGFYILTPKSEIIGTPEGLDYDTASFIVRACNIYQLDKANETQWRL